mmetsp:Transcript_60363/g.171048  ORF Transcript_60363/g.171048 Transcript_60363/m.171048 type:complete len:286 (+) Transcript_60363:719-1576(+)
MSTTLSSPSKATTARRMLVLCLATATALKPAGSASTDIWRQAHLPPAAAPEHSASLPPEVTTSSPDSSHVTAWISPSMPSSWKRVESFSPIDWTSAPRPPLRSKVATMPACEARRAGWKSAGHWTPACCISASLGARTLLEGMSKASARGAKAAAKRCANDVTLFWPARRRSQPPAWQFSWRVPLRVQGDIQGCMCEGQRSTRPSCFSRKRSPLICSKPRPNMMRTHMEIDVMMAPLKSFHGSMECEHSLAFLWGTFWPFWPLAAFISCVRHVWPRSRCLGADTR